MGRIKQVKRTIKRKIKKYLKRFAIKTYRWLLQTGDVRAAEKNNTYVNDTRFNFASIDNLDIETKKIMLAQMFYYKIGYYPNIDNPKTFSEKVLWLKLYHEDNRISICSDKYLGKSYIDNVLGKGYTVPVIQKYDDVCDIDLDKLPEKFVLKVNWCTGYNIIVSDKKNVDIDAIRAKLDFWRLPWRSSYYGSFNWGYKNVKPVIFAEKYLNISKNPREYKMFCFNGNVEFTLVEEDYFGKAPKRVIYDRNWKELPFSFEKIPKAQGIDCPKKYEEMINIAEKLSHPFPYVRIDFYDVDDRIYVGEMTFYSGGGFTKIEPIEWDDLLGEKLDITEIVNKKKENRNQNEI